MPRRTAIFVNEGAGSARTDRVRRAVALAATALEADILSVDTRDRTALEAWLRDRLDATPYDTVVVAGGDGSLGVAYNVVAGRELTLGYIPAGFGNATSHLLRLPRRPQQLVEVLARGEARPVNLVSIGDRLALFAGAGWDATVAGRYAAAGARRLVGWGAAIAQSLNDLRRPAQVEVVADGETVHRGPMEMAVVSVTPYYGRGLLVNPGVRPDDDRLMLRVYPGPLPAFTVETVRWVAHRRPSAPGRRATIVELRSADGSPIPVQADGDLVGSREAWRFELRPAAARLIGRWR